MSENPTKRQRLTGSFSPASPPYHLAKQEQSKPSIIHPSTPTSPPYMSSGSHANGGSATAASAPPSEITPPSSVHMSQQVSQPATSTMNPLTFPTPSSTTGANFNANTDSDGDAMMTDDNNEDSTRMRDSGTNQHRQSNHDWNSGSLASKDIAFGEVGATGESLARLCKKPLPMSRPHVSQNMIDIFGLNSIASSVARHDAEGQKINKLRKSYEGKIKELQIAGKPKAIKVQPFFMGLLAEPEENYVATKVNGRDVKDGLSSDVLGLLDRALSMNPGKLPVQHQNHYRTYLGTDDGAKPKMTAEGLGKKGLQPVPSGRNSAAPSPALKPQKADRPERVNAKRKYTEDTFFGYGEGFADDGGESTGAEDDGRRGFGIKKRKKDITANSPFGLDRAGHQMGVVGVRR